jgi:hypothetical protein
MRKAFVMVVVGCAALALFPSTASPQAGPSVTVTPDTGLVDGQTVTVQGSGFDPLTTSIGVAQCPVGGTFADCIGQKIIPASGGSFSTTFTVQRFALTVDCASVARRCFIGASNLDPAPSFRDQAFGPLTFAGAAPETKDDCKNGGWRNLADDQHRSFKNQGDCVSFVATGGKNKATG